MPSMLVRRISYVARAAAVALDVGESRPRSKPKLVKFVVDVTEVRCSRAFPQSSAAIG